MPVSAELSAVAWPPPLSSSAVGPAEQAAQYPLTRTIPLRVLTTCGNYRQTVEGPTADGISTVGCISPSVASAVAPRVAAPAASLCKQNAVVRSRHASCGVATIKYKVIQLPSKRVLGRGTVLVLYQEVLNALSRKWSLELSIEMVAASGVVEHHTKATIGMSCTGGCGVFPLFVQRTLSLDKVYSFTYHITSSGAKTYTTRQTPIVGLGNPAATKQSPPFTLLNLGPARCDSGVAYKGTSGCVFSDTAGSYVLHLKGSVGAVAAHIQTAQQTKPRHFGWYGHGSPLTRATSAAVAKANRSVACPKKKYPNPDTCDEYPFAATYQGAAFFPQSNSSAPVSAKENSAEGGYRAAMYRAERLFNQDPYWVFIVP